MDVKASTGACISPSFPITLNSGGLVCQQPSNVTGNSATATALAANGTNCGAGNYPLGVDASGNAESCTTAGAGDVSSAASNILTGDNNFATWRKFTISYTQLAAAATSSSVVVAIAPAGAVIQGVKIKHDQPFTGGTISAYTVSVSSAPGLANYASAFDIFQTTSSTVFQLSQNFRGEQTNATWNVYANAESVGANLSAAAQGSVDVWLLMSVLP
jgi:hypothetical protein